MEADTDSDHIIFKTKENKTNKQTNKHKKPQTKQQQRKRFKLSGGVLLTIMIMLIMKAIVIEQCIHLL